MPGLHGDGQGGEAVVVLGKDICIRILQQVLDDSGMAMFSRTHQGGGAVLISDVHVSAGFD